MQAAVNYATSYVNDIPANWGRESLRAFIIGFTVTSVITGNPVAGAVSGAMGILTTSIHAAVSPIFKRLHNSNVLGIAGEWARGTLALIGASYFAAALGNPMPLANLSLAATIYGLWIAFLSNSSWRNVNSANPMAVF